MPVRAMRIITLFWLVVLGTVRSAEAGVLLQGFYWDVPSPAAGNAMSVWWWDRLAAQAQAFRKAGFTAIWLPPVTKGASGGYSVGYDPYDDYDIGSKEQKGILPTRYGTREQLARCVAMMRAAGLDVYLDLVQNHRNGDEGEFRFRYKDAYGIEGGGRFAKNANDFHPNVPQDPEVPLGNSEYQFGRDIAHVNGEGGRIGKDLEAAGDWVTRALGVQGYRLDYVKGISAQWLREFLRYGAMKGKFTVGEYYDGNLDLVSGWVRDGMQNRVSAFDFPLRGLLQQMCGQNGGFDMRLLDRAGLMGRDPLHAVTFVENHDTDRDSPIVKGKMLAYAFILTSEGYPSIFYKDYSMEAGCYKLKPRLDKLLWVHETLAQGATLERWKEGDVFVYERTGGSRLLVGLSDNPSEEKTVTVQTGFGANVSLRDYVGHMPDITTDAQGLVTLNLPMNKDGTAYVCYAPRMRVRRSLQISPKRVMQEFRGAKDLDIRPAETGHWVTIGRIWPRAGREISAQLFCDTSKWKPATRVSLELVGPTGKREIAEFRKGTRRSLTLKAIASRSGWHVFRILAFRTPPENPRPSYRLKVNYLASQSLSIK